MKFVFADSMDYVDPHFDFIKDQTAATRNLTGTTNIPTRSLAMPHTMACWSRVLSWVTTVSLASTARRRL